MKLLRAITGISSPLSGVLQIVIMMKAVSLTLYPAEPPTQQTFCSDRTKPTQCDVT